MQAPVTLAGQVTAGFSQPVATWRAGPRRSSGRAILGRAR